jgi:hypothetical protein
MLLLQRIFKTVKTTKSNGTYSAFSRKASRTNRQWRKYFATVAYSAAIATGTNKPAA